ncbi:MAG: TerC family protein [bacterium]
MGVLILGLRAMYFLLADLIHRFVYLKLGLSLVLVWVGIKMIVSHAVIKIPTGISLGIVVLIIAVSIGASLVATVQSRRATRSRPNSTRKGADHETTPSPCPRRRPPGRRGDRPRHHGLLSRR